MKSLSIPHLDKEFSVQFAVGLLSFNGWQRTEGIALSSLEMKENNRATDYLLMMSDAQ